MSKYDEYSPVSIKYMVLPDFQVVCAQEQKYSDKVCYFKYSLILSENIIVEEECNEGGEVETYRNPVYYSCRVKDNFIEILDPQNCWISAYYKLNNAYRDSLANKELLGV